MKQTFYSIMAACAMLLFPSMAKANWSDYVIILDPGHGGDDPGAVYNGSTQNNCTESWLVLQCEP